MALSILDDKDVKPTPAELAKVLGLSEELWHQLISMMEADYGALSKDWNFAGAKYGWSCRLRRKQRTVLYLIPQNQSFLVALEPAW